MTASFPEGEGIFETIKTIRAVPYAMTRHLARATRSAAILGMRIQSERQIRNAVSEFLVRTPATLEYGRLRIAFHPAGELEMVHETYHPWTSPARLAVSDKILDETSPLVGMKTLPYSANIEALNWARDQGFDDAVHFNSSGQIVEGSVSNIVLKVDGHWHTPNLASGCLPGITRGLVLEWLDVEEAVLTSEDLAKAESIYLLSSLKDAQPVSMLEDRALEIDEDIRRELADRMAQEIDP